VTLTRSDIYSVVRCNKYKLDEVNTSLDSTSQEKNADFPEVKWFIFRGRL